MALLMICIMYSCAILVYAGFEPVSIDNVSPKNPNGRVFHFVGVLSSAPTKNLVLSLDIM
jgi:hypothetical protein